MISTSFLLLLLAVLVCLFVETEAQWGYGGYGMYGGYGRWYRRRMWRMGYPYGGYYGWGK